MRGVDKKVETAEACGQAAQSGPEGMGPGRPGPGGSHVRRVALWHRRAGGRGPAGRGGPMEERGPVMWRSVAAAAPRTEAAPGQWAKGGPEGRGPGRPGPGGPGLGRAWQSYPVAPAGGRTGLGGAGRLLEKSWPVKCWSVAAAAPARRPLLGKGPRVALKAGARKAGPRRLPRGKRHPVAPARGRKGPGGTGGPMEKRGPVMRRSVAAAAVRTEAAPGQGAEGGPEGRGQEGPAPAALTWEEPPGGTVRRAHRARRGGAALLKEQGW
jgi:hypothetical protein